MNITSLSCREIKDNIDSSGFLRMQSHIMKIFEWIKTWKTRREEASLYANLIRLSEIIRTISITEI